MPEAVADNPKSGSEGAVSSLRSSGRQLVVRRVPIIMREHGTTGNGGANSSMVGEKMNALCSDVPGASDYTSPGFASMFSNTFDKAVLPNTPKKSIVQATQAGMPREGLYFAAYFRDYDAFKTAWKSLHESVRFKLKTAPHYSRYNLYQQYFFSSRGRELSKLERRMKCFKSFGRYYEKAKELARQELSAIVASPATSRSEKKRAKKDEFTWGQRIKDVCTCDDLPFVIVN